MGDTRSIESSAAATGFEARVLLLQILVLGPGSSVTRRFPVVQGRKIRPIDDFTASMINLTNSSQESVGLHGAEIIAASLVHWFCSCHALGVVDTDLKVQTWDLWKAYKQLSLSDAAREKTFMAIWNPLDACVKLYRHCALPFGGRASVNAFCRASRSLWVLGTVQLSFFWTNYFDDYVLFSRPLRLGIVAVWLACFSR